MIVPKDYFNVLYTKSLMLESLKKLKTQKIGFCSTSDLQQGPKKGLTDARSAVGFCLGSGLFGSYNSD